jgi:hypothetical protein
MGTPKNNSFNQKTNYKHSKHKNKPSIAHNTVEKHKFFPSKHEKMGTPKNNPNNQKTIKKRLKQKTNPKTSLTTINKNPKQQHKNVHHTQQTTHKQAHIQHFFFKPRPNQATKPSHRPTNNMFQHRNTNKKTKKETKQYV